MVYDPSSAFGVEIKIGSGTSSETFTEIPGVHNGPNGPERTRRIIEGSHHGSDSLVQKTSFKSNGTISFDIYYDSTETTHTNLKTCFETPTRRNFQMVLTDQGDEQYAFAAYVTTFSNRNDVEGFSVVSVVLTIDGEITTT